MSLDIPHRYEPQIREVAESRHISTDEALERVIQAGLEKLISVPKKPSVSNASLFGSVKGAGAHGSKEAVDLYLAELRAAW